MAIQQGDKYSIPVSIKQGSTVITPDNCVDVKISIGGVIKKYSDNELYYNSQRQMWEFPLTTDISDEALLSNARWQVAVKFENDIIYSAVYPLSVYPSLIREDW